MKTSSGERPADVRRRRSTFPADPTKGRPVESSSLPGASPTKRTLASTEPSPGIACFRPSWSRQSVHRTTREAVSSSIALRSDFPRIPMGSPRRTGHLALRGAFSGQLCAAGRELLDARRQPVDLPLVLRTDSLVPLLRLHRIHRVLFRGDAGAANHLPVGGVNLAQPPKLAVDLPDAGNRRAPPRIPKPTYLARGGFRLATTTSRTPFVNVYLSVSRSASEGRSIAEKKRRSPSPSR